MKHFVSYVSPEKFTTITYQIIFLIITCGSLVFLLYKPITEFHAVGKRPFIQPVTQETTASWGKTPAHVNVGMHITDFLRFDTVKNEFIINAFIWFSFDQKQVSPEIIDKFSFTKGEILQKSDAKFIKADSTTTALYMIRVQFSSILDYSRFPLDDHRLFLNLINPAMTADELVYVGDTENFIISPNMYISGWKVVGHEVQSGYAPIALGKNQQLLQNKTVFSLDLSKGDVRQLSLIILPLLFLFYLGLFAFSIRDNAVAMTLPIASSAGLLAYSFVIQTLAPAVGYMLLSDYLFIFFLFSTFVIFFVKALAMVPEHILSRAALKDIEGWTVVGSQVALIIVWYLLLDARGI